MGQLGLPLVAALIHLPQGVATVCHEGGAGHVAGLRGGEEGNGIGDLVRRAHAPERSTAYPVVAHCVCPEEAFDQGGMDIAGRHGVHPHAVRAHSAAKDFVNMMTPALETLYATCGWGRLTMMPDIEAILTMQPEPCSIIRVPKTWLQ